MDSYVQREVAEAVASGASLSAIEETIIDRASLDEEHRAALWLFAEALRARRHAHVPGETREPVFIGG